HWRASTWSTCSAALATFRCAAASASTASIAGCAAGSGPSEFGLGTAELGDGTTAGARVGGGWGVGAGVVVEQATQAAAARKISASMSRTFRTLTVGPVAQHAVNPRVNFRSTESSDNSRHAIDPTCGRSAALRVLWGQLRVLGWRARAVLRARR